MSEVIDINPKPELIRQLRPSEMIRCGICGNKVYDEDKDLNFGGKPICFNCFKHLKPPLPKMRCEICGRDKTDTYLIRFSHSYKNENTNRWVEWVNDEREVCANCNNDFVVFTLQNWTKEGRKRTEVGDLKKTE